MGDFNVEYQTALCVNSTGTKIAIAQTNYYSPSSGVITKY